MKQFKLLLLGIVVPVTLLAQTVQKDWVQQFNATGDYRDCVYAIATDAQGNIYVTGQGFGKTSMCDMTTIKYSPSGEVLWMDAYNGPGNGPDKPYDLKLDRAGNVIVTGISWGGEETFEDFATLKYSSDGKRLWEKRYDGPAHDYDGPARIAIDKNNNVYVTGISWGGEDTWEDFAVVKYSADGEEIWVERYNGAENDMDVPHALAVDDNFNVYVAGSSISSYDTDEDFVTIKYSQPDELRREEDARRAQAAAAAAAAAATQKPKKKWGFGKR